MLQIVTDSSALFPAAEARKLGFYSLPLYVIADSVSYRDFEDISAETFTELTGSAEHLSTSQPTIGEKIDLYDSLLEDPDNTVLDLCMADGLSGTYQSSLSARSCCIDPDRVTVMNTKTLCGPHRQMVQKALSLRDMGKGSEEIVQILNEGTAREASSVCVRDISHLVRSGRLSKAAGAAGSFLKLMPLAVKNDEGRLEVYGAGRTWKKIFELQERFLKSKGFDESWTLFLTHGKNPEAAEKARQYFSARYPDLKIVINELNAMFMVHGGEGCLAVQAIAL